MSWDPPRHPRFQRRHLCCQRDKAHPTGAVVFIVLAIEDMSVPQIAIAIGVLTSNRGGGRRTTLADWTWHQGTEDVVPLPGAIVGNFGGVDVVPLQGAIVVCYGWGGW